MRDRLIIIPAALLCSLLMMALITAGQNQPLAFEVAAVKENTGNGPADTRFNPAGVTVRWSRLLDLIATAYQIPYSRISAIDARTRDLFSTRYDVVATAGQQVTRDELLMMLQGLLAERFKLRLHHEEKVQPVYKLVVANGGPKLQESKPTPNADQNCKFPQCMPFHNTEMWVFAATLTGRMDRPVLDMTGLKGAYDFSLRLDTLERLTAADPDLKAKGTDWSTSSIFTDIEKQLGLKLESDKAPVKFLVIDHVEKPSEN